MLSILIPIYQYPVFPLVQELHKQAQGLNVPWEIICLDDGSEAIWKNQNRSLSKLKGVNYQESDDNLGRSLIRNTLAQKAQYPYLLFMDCDSGVVRPDFLEQYLEHIHPQSVLCGGRVYAKDPPTDSKYILHWAYGKSREERSANSRKKSPYHAFMSNNFVVPASVITDFPFDEALTQYGHEDTLFGIALETANIPVVHIDNPLEHLGLETTDVFLHKSRQALENLAFLRKNKQYIKTRLIHVYDQIEQNGMTRIVQTILRIIRPVLRYNLHSRSPNLRFFDAYRLEQFIISMRK